jgi:hypothetical protein
MPRRPLALACAAVLALVAFSAPVASAATITIVNNDGLGEGFNDPTPVAPVGGNPGETRGAQRLFIFQTAAAIWGSILPSTVEIRVNSTFNPLACDATSAVLGSAGTTGNVSDFAGAEVANTWYPVALANRLAGVDLAPAINDINAQFNSTLDNGTCLGGATWYYGIDGNEGGQIELLPVVLHELGHGLGFAATTSLTTGGMLSNRPNIYERHLLDRTLGPAGTAWPAMTNAQRVSAARNTWNLVWTGEAVATIAPTVLGPRVDFAVVSPAPIAGPKIYGNAEFGPAPDQVSLAGEIVLADDGVPPGSDACEGIVNGPQLAGKVALIDRGTCTFVEKAANAEAVGAIAVVIANNVAGAPPAMGGELPTLTIPVISISQADGDAIKAELLNGPVTVSLGPNPAFVAGCDDEGRPRLYAPNPVEQGSSVSHWDTSAEPSLLMEPFITDGLSGEVDLTEFAFTDIGWTPPLATDAPGGLVAARLALASGRPNPFLGRTSIAFDLPRAGRADLVVYDVSGRAVKRLVGSDLPAGRHAVTWDATDDRGARVAPGVYFYRLTQDGQQGTRSVVFVAPERP